MVLGCREKGQHLGQLLQDRRADAALELLSAQPALVWVRDDKSGGYPLHIAVWHVGLLSCSTFALLLFGYLKIITDVLQLRICTMWEAIFLMAAPAFGTSRASYSASISQICLLTRV